MRPTTSVGSNNSHSDFYFEPTSLCEEDCRFLLREIEKQAFEHIICAFRAQGPLTQYKELLLEHIKSALFISDEDFILQARIVANNPYLTRIADQLNPSYDNFFEWIAAGFDLTGVDLARARKLSLNKGNLQYSEEANQILSAIHKHNRNLPNENVTLQELYQLPKQPFVPERLRRFLQDTETDSRIDIVKKQVVTEELKKPPRNGVGRPRKHQKKCQPNENINKELSSSFVAKPAAASNKKTSNDKSAEEQAVLAILAKSSAQILQEAEQKQQEQQKHNEELPSTSTAAMESLAEVALSQIPEPTQIQLINNEMVRDKNSTTENHLNSNPSIAFHVNVNLNQHRLQQPETQPLSHDSIDNTVEMVMSGLYDQSNITYKPKRKRTAKQLQDDSTCVCARVLPFVFEKALPGQSKPPRGNPERKNRTIKRANATQPNDYAFDINNLPPISQSYYPEVHSNLNYYNQTPTTVRVVKQSHDTMDTAKHLTTAENLHNFLPTENTVVIDLHNNYQAESFPTNNKFANMTMNNSLVPIPLASNLIDQSQQHPTIIHPRELTVIHSTTADHSYEKNPVTQMTSFGTSAIIPAISPVQHNAVENNSSQQIASQPSLIVVNTIPDSTHQLLKMQNHVNVENGIKAKSVKSTCKTISTKNDFSNSISTLSSTSAISDTTLTFKQLITPRVVSTKNTAVESSGLDFLASTASLLAPLETNSLPGPVSTKQSVHE